MDKNPLHRQIVAADSEQLTLDRIRDLLNNQGKGESRCSLKLVHDNGEPEELPLSVLQGLAQLVTYLARGQIVTLVPLNKDLTTQQAADLLNVSRPFLVKLLEQGDIPFVKTGTHRRVRFADLTAYQQRRDTTRRQFLTELTQVSQELGLYDEQG